MDTLEEPIMSDTSEEEQENVIEKPKRVRKPLSPEQKEALVKRLADARAKKKAEKAEKMDTPEVVKPVKIPKAVKVVEPVAEPEPIVKKQRSPRKPKAVPEAPTTIITNNYYEKPVEEKKAKATRKPKEPKAPKVTAQEPPKLMNPPPTKTLVFV